MPIHVRLEGGELTVAADAEGLSRPIRVGVGDEVVDLRPGDRQKFALQESGVTRHQYQPEGMR
jgi:hypothetical protein